MATIKFTEFTARKRNLSITWVALIFCIGLQIEMNIWFFISWTPQHHIAGVVAGNILLAFINFPSLFIFPNYYAHSHRMRLVLTYEELQLFKNDQLICTMKNSEIIRIESVESNAVKVLWSKFSYLKFTDRTGKQMIITHFVLQPGDLWLDPLSRKINNKNIILTRKFFPYIKETPSS